MHQTSQKYLSLFKNLLKSLCGGTGIRFLQLAAESSYVPYPLYGGSGCFFCSTKIALFLLGRSIGVKSSAVDMTDKNWQYVTRSFTWKSISGWQHKLLSLLHWLRRLNHCVVYAEGWVLSEFCHLVPNIFDNPFDAPHKIYLMLDF